MKNYDLEFTIIKEKGKEFLQLDGSDWPRDVRENVVVNGENYSFSHGKDCFWIFRVDEPLGVKFFMTKIMRERWVAKGQWSCKSEKRLYLAPATLKRVKEIFKIQKILFDNGVAPEPKEIITCSVNGKRAGYGMIMEKVIPVDAADWAENNARKFITNLSKVLKENNIKHNRGGRGKPRDKTTMTALKKASAGESRNILITEEGYKVVDLQEFYLQTK